MTKRIEELDKALAELRHEYQKVEAPLFLETRLRAAARDRQPRSLVFPLLWRWSLSVLAFVALGVVLWHMQRPDHEIVLQSKQEQPVPVVRSSTPSSATESSAPGKLVSQTAKARKQPVERVTEFYSLPESEVLPEPSAESVLRTIISGSELRRYGFDVPPSMASDSVRADFLVGDDGLARAVRLVQ